MPLLISKRPRLALQCVILIIFSSAIISAVSAEEKTITFNIGPDGYPPYMIKSNSGHPTGIMVDVLEYITKKKGYRVVESNIPRKRVEQWLLSGKLDVTARAKEWTENPDLFVFTTPIVQCSEVIFVRKGSGINRLEDLFGKRMGTRLGYYHKDLEPYFRDKRIVRENAPNEWAMFKMLEQGRVDAVSCVELVGQWTIRQNHWEGRFSILKKEVSSYGYRLMFSTKWRPFVQQFNEEFEEMKKNGELDKILSKYR